MTSEPDRELEGIVEVDVDQIIVPPERVTSVFEPETWEEFLESVRTEGIKVPIIVMNVNGKLYLIDGLHRIKAAKELGIKRIKAIVKLGTMDDLLIENIITARLRGRENPAQTAKVVKRLRDQFGYSWNDIAKRLGMSPGTVKMYYDITRLPEQVLQLVGEGKLSVSKARLLLEIPNARDQVRAAEDIVKYGYTEMQARELVRYYLEAYIEGPVTPEPRKEPRHAGPELVCAVCRLEFDENPTYFWIHQECLAELMRAYAELQEIKKAKIGSDETGSTSEPLPQHRELAPTESTSGRPEGHR